MALRRICIRSGNVSAARHAQYHESARNAAQRTTIRARPSGITIGGTTQAVIARSRHPGRVAGSAAERLRRGVAPVARCSQPKVRFVGPAARANSHIDADQRAVMPFAQMSQAAREFRERGGRRQVEDGGAGCEHGHDAILRGMSALVILHGMSLLGSARLCREFPAAKRNSPPQLAAESIGRSARIADRVPTRCSITNTSCRRRAIHRANRAGRSRRSAQAGRA